MNPELAQQIGISTLAICVMLSVGLDLRWQQVTAALRRPKLMGVGLGLNLFIAPLIGLGFARLFGLEPVALLAMVLVASAPGGPYGSVLVAQVKANLGFSVALVFLMTSLSTFTAPLMMTLLTSAELEATGINIGPEMAKKIGLFQLLPLAVGMLGKRLKPELAAKGSVALRLLVNVLFGLVAVGILVKYSSDLVSIGWRPIATVSACVVVFIVLGWVVSPGNARDRGALGINSGIHNLPLAMLVGGVLFADEPAGMLVILTYGALMLPGAVGFALWLRSRTGSVPIREDQTEPEDTHETKRTDSPSDLPART